MLLRTCRMQFWHLCRKSFTREPKTDPPKSKNRNFLKTINFVRIFLQTPKMLFSQSCWKRFNKRPNKFVQKTKLLKKAMISEKKIFFLRRLFFLGKCCYSQVEGTLTTPQKAFPQYSKSLCSLSEQNVKKMISSESNIFH